MKFNEMEDPTDNINIIKRGAQVKRRRGFKKRSQKKWQPIRLSIIMGVPNNYL